MMMKYNFNETEDWDVQLYYSIYICDEIKYIKINYETDRVSLNKTYLSWIVKEYHDCIMTLNDFLRWDVYYQLDKLCSESTYDKYECEPDIAFKKANKYIKGIDGNGSKKLMLCNISKDTECGNYYGL